MLTATLQPERGNADAARADADLLLASTPAGEAAREAQFVVPGIHCAGCIVRIERALSALPGVAAARVNLSTKRVRVRWTAAPPPVIATLAQLGFSAHLHEDAAEGHDAIRAELVRALAVAGFAAMNIMLLSVSVWAGAGDDVRQLFHWISALIALPTLVYSGRIFFRSAWRSLRRGQTNMDVPISIGVATAFGLSLYETITHGPHAYFDASVTLLFFLLIGRTLDHVMRGRARTAVLGLERLAARSATTIGADGAQRRTPVADIVPGDTLLIAAGERVPVNAEVIEGASELDVSLLSGESAPEAVRAGARLWAGSLNLTGPLTARATAAAAESFLADMTRMMEAAEMGRAGYRRIADRAARLYAPVVHLTALLTLIGWWTLDGDLHRAITIAVAVLIITCPCALGLAVPMVHVAAARRLFADGVMVKDGAALERLAEIDSVIFDKTGTLTLPEPVLEAMGPADAAAADLAAALAAQSQHPYARAVASLPQPSGVRFEAVREESGAGIEGFYNGKRYRLGRAAWACDAPADGEEDDAVTFGCDGAPVARFRFTHRMRPGAQAGVAALVRQDLPVEVLSGDHETPVRRLAEHLGAPWRARVTPGGKIDHVKRRMAEGRRPLMVGDGVNDAPALAAAYASMAPGSAADVGRNAADFVFLRPSLAAVPQAVRIARRAAALVRQNMTLAVAYNIIAVPIAIAGFVTPLVAAIAMSASSVLVVANAWRLAADKEPS